VFGSVASDPTVSRFIDTVRAAWSEVRSNVWSWQAITRRMRAVR
jgi:hypothetical protein